MDFVPGQYVQVRIPGRGEPTYRAYSISSPPSRKGEIELLVLEAVVSLLGPALQAVAADAARGRAHSEELAGLRYRGVIGPNRAMREVLAR